VTFSIVGRSADGLSWGVAVASKFLAVGCAVPAARAGSGAIATQAEANVGYKLPALAMLANGDSAADVIQALTTGDDRAEHRQVGVVDRFGGAATHTGTSCLDWAGGTAQRDVAIQGNILVGPEVVEAMHGAWDEAGDRPLAHRLLAALTAGDRAGGDRRGRQSAALYVVQDGAGYGGYDDVAVDLRVDDHPDPIPELARLLDLNDFYLSVPPEADRVPVDETLAADLDARARQRGAESFDAWVGTENYERRVAEDGSWVDRRVLDLLDGS
jgi:uncharacterized Ntn-hydrolase superfamily protein